MTFKKTFLILEPGRSLLEHRRPHGRLELFRLRFGDGLLALDTLGNLLDAVCLLPDSLNHLCVVIGDVQDSGGCHAGHLLEELDQLFSLLVADTDVLTLLLGMLRCLDFMRSFCIVLNLSLIHISEPTRPY